MIWVVCLQNVSVDGVTIANRVIESTDSAPEGVNLLLSILAHDAAAQSAPSAMHLRAWLQCADDLNGTAGNVTVGVNNTCSRYRLIDWRGDVSDATLFWNYLYVPGMFLGDYFGMPLLS